MYSAHIYGIQKNGADDPICREGMGDADVENGLVDSAKEGEGGKSCKK